jgi:hypothetical protein
MFDGRLASSLDLILLARLCSFFWFAQRSAAIVKLLPCDVCILLLRSVVSREINIAILLILGAALTQRGAHDGMVGKSAQCGARLLARLQDFTSLQTVRISSKSFTPDPKALTSFGAVWETFFPFVLKCFTFFFLPHSP